MIKADLFFTKKDSALIQNAINLRFVLHLAFIVVLTLLLLYEWSVLIDRPLIMAIWFIALIYPIMVYGFSLKIKWVADNLVRLTDAYALLFIFFSLTSTYLTEINLTSSLIAIISIIFSFAIIRTKAFFIICLAEVFVITLGAVIFTSGWDANTMTFAIISFYTALLSFILSNILLNELELMRQYDLQYRLLAENSTDIIMVHRLEDHSCSYISPSVTPILGYEQEEIMDNYGLMYVHPEDAEDFKQLLLNDIYQDETSILKSFRVKNNAGEYVWMELSATVVREDDEIKYLTMAMRDITERKEYESAIETANKQLEKAIRQYETSNQELEQFAYMTSHDLKEPLRTISSYIQLIEQRYGESIDEQGREFMEFVVDGAQRMSNMIDDILAFSRVGGNALSLKPLDMNMVVAQATKSLKNKIEESKATIEVNNLPVLRADELQMTLLFQNLIDNAMKYRGEKEPVVQIKAVRDGRSWVFSVSDNGIGIRQEFKSRIFKAFRRLHGIEKYKGTGIGLAICKKIVENHDGEIWVESPGENLGATFLFSIPLEIEPLGQDPGGQNPATQGL